jgi:hypothetical protein
VKSPTHPKPHLIEVNIRDVHQLFNSMDPSPFHERDLDHDAEQFIVSWAQECHHRVPIQLVVHMQRAPEGLADPEKLVTESFHHYFDYQAQMKVRELKQMMREGRFSLIIGLLFITVCHLVASLVLQGSSSWMAVAREGLTISGWVAMWKPIDIYLYRWWPLLRLKRLYRKLSESDVEVRVSKD